LLRTSSICGAIDGISVIGSDPYILKGSGLLLIDSLERFKSKYGFFLKLVHLGRNEQCVLFRTHARW
jgi:hypothetical protein